MAKKVGVLGSGVVARVLAEGFSRKGHPVAIGSREKAKVESVAREIGATPGTFAEVAAFGEIVVLAVKGTAAEDALRLAGDGNLRGKIVIDTTNPLDDAPPENGVLRLFTGPNESLMERLQAAFPEARFVKAWNSVGNAYMVDPNLPGGPPTMFYCGDDPAARAEVATILRSFGWHPEDVGGATSARGLEPLVILWCLPGFLRNQWTHAFKLLKTGAQGS